ncbi:MAG: RidA family protein [Pseudomonadota bacterium]
MSTSLRLINPAPLARPSGYSHVAVAPVHEIAFISGQVAYDGAGHLVGAGDLAAQTRQVMQNLSDALQAVGADFSHVAKLTIFVKDLDEAAVATIREVRADFLSPTAPPTSTMIGVTALVRPELLVEIEAYAVLPAST